MMEMNGQLKKQSNSATSNPKRVDFEVGGFRKFEKYYLPIRDPPHTLHEQRRKTH